MTKVTHLTLDESGGLSRKRIHLREISGDADAPLETVGQDLRAARLRRGDDLATASRALKIRKDHLEALEEDRFEALPGRTYAIGFVRSYAEYLGLDPMESVERFKSEIAGRDEASKPPVFHDSDEERRLPHGWMVIAVVVLALVVYGAYRLARSADSMLSEPVASVPARIAPPPVKPPPPARVAQKPTPPLAVATAAPADTAAQSATASPVAAQPSTPAAAPAAQAAAQEPATEPLPVGHVYGQRNDNPRIILHALEPAKVLIESADGVVYINRTLQRGDVYRVPDLVGLTLSTPNLGALQVELDGQMMGLAGRPNQFAEALSLDPQAVVDRYNSQRPR